MFVSIKLKNATKLKEHSKLNEHSTDIRFDLKVYFFKYFPASKQKTFHSRPFKL